MNIDRSESGNISNIFLKGQQLLKGEGWPYFDGELWYIPKSLISDILIKDLPEDAIFKPCNSIEDHNILMDRIVFCIRNIGNNKVKISYEDNGTGKLFDRRIGLKPYMEAKRDAVKERQLELGDLAIEKYKDDGRWILLSYSTEIEAENLSTVIELAEQIYSEIEGTVETSLGSQSLSIENIEDEKHFSLHIVLPILRKLGFTNIRYNHGKREYGKDIVFARHTEFLDTEYWAAQVKFGDVSGGADSDIDKIIGQAEDAFKMPFYDIYSRRKQRISKLAIIISGKFTENATEKICEKIESHSLKNNLIFVDRDRLVNFAETLRNKG
ncbi:MAG: restriction endonuclease [Nitrospirae bacterium]|nr:restriction endonuclease [Nitrospirota bacterium]